MSNMVNGGFYNGQQYWNGQLGAPGQILNPNQGKPDPTSSDGQSSGGANYSTPDYAAIAKQFQQMQIDANQPAIKSLQASISPLQDRYNAILDSIKGQGSVAENAQTLASNNSLGKRGILPSSGLYQQTAASDLLPVTTQYAGLQASTGLAEQQDVNGINNQIAALQAGNVGQSITGANGIANIAAQLQQAQAANATSIQNQAKQVQFQGVKSGDSLVNTLNGQILTPGGQQAPAPTPRPPNNGGKTNNTSTNNGPDFNQAISYSPSGTDRIYG